MKAAAFAPGTVSNVACGFDVLGFALEEPGDHVVAIVRDQPGVEILEITGDGGRLPREADRNTASVAARALLSFRLKPEATGDKKPEATGDRKLEAAADRNAEAGADRKPQAAGDRKPEATGDRKPEPTATDRWLPASAGRGVSLIIRKGLPLSSGIGSSGASAVAAVLAVNEALGLGASSDILLRAAMEGERVSAGEVHPDNVAPALLGGFVLARSVDPPDVVRLPVPAGLACAILLPAIEIETRAARALLPAAVPLRDAVRQWANVGALVSALHSGDLDLLGRAMVDYIIEPHRAVLVPGFARIRAAAVDAGAIGCNLSGSGPAMFALCRSLEAATGAGEAMVEALRAYGGIDGKVIVSRVGTSGARIIQGAMPNAQ